MAQAHRQAARRTALDAVARARKDKVEHDDRIAATAVDVLTALAQRDAAVAGFEAQAGRALNRLIDTEDLTLNEAVQWLDGQLSAREATRLRRLDPGLDPALGEQTAAEQPVAGHSHNDNSHDDNGDEVPTSDAETERSAPARPRSA